jgi:hypothetical protein
MNLVASWDDIIKAEMGHAIHSCCNRGEDFRYQTQSQTVRKCNDGVDEHEISLSNPAGAVQVDRSGEMALTVSSPQAAPIHSILPLIWVRS